MKTEKEREYFDVTGNRASRLLLILGGFFIANALIAEFIGIKIFSLEETLGFHPANIPVFGFDLSFNLTAGVLLWPVVFVMTDIINEYYGSRGVRMLSFLAAGLIAYAYLMVYLGIKLSPAAWWIESYSARGLDDAQLAFRLIFGQGLGIIIGSLIAFLIGQVVDVYVFHRIKKITGEKALWLRATGSTFVSQFIDSYVVLAIAFFLVPKLSGNAGQPWSIQQVLAIGSINYIYKFVIAGALTPVIYLGHYLIESYLGHDLAAKLKKEALAGHGDR